MSKDIYLIKILSALLLSHFNRYNTKLSRGISATFTKLYSRAN